MKKALMIVVKANKMNKAMTTIAVLTKRFIFSFVLILLLFFFLLSCSISKKENNLQSDTVSETITETTSAETKPATAVPTTILTTTTETAETTIIEKTTETETLKCCKNSYFPVNENTIWNYKDNNHPIGYSVSFILVKENSFTEIIKNQKNFYSQKSRKEIKWICNEKGLIQTELTQINYTDPITFIYEFETTGFEGITFPPENEMKVGKNWEISYVAKAELKAGDAIQTTGINVKIENKIVSIESVKMQSGNYPEALKITSKMTGYTSLGSEISQLTASTSDSWFVKDIGLVRQVSKSENIVSTIELLSLN